MLTSDCHPDSPRFYSFLIGHKLMRQSAVDLSSECSLNELNCIKSAIIDNCKSGNFLEIGTAAGGTLKEMIRWSREADLEAVFWVLDPFIYYDGQMDKVKTNLQRNDINPDSVNFIIGTTDEHYPDFCVKKMAFSFVFIDGCHKAHSVMKDLKWASLLSENGIMCLHDHGLKFPGVIWALARFLKKNPNFCVIDQSETLIVVKKLTDGTCAVSYYDLVAARISRVIYKLGISLKKRFSVGAKS